jgi:hypothetical protein
MCQTAHDAFTSHVLEAVGMSVTQVTHGAELTLGLGHNICVPPTPIAATVHGDSNQDDKPLL